MDSKNHPNEIRITRIYHAPVNAVWDAWTDLAQVAKWWGPRGFTLTTHSKELKAGGGWSYTMHGPDGTNYPNKTLYHEVVPYSRLVYDHGGNDDRPPLFRVRVDFIDLKDKTKMEMSMMLPSAEAAVETRKFIKQAGGEATWDRLAEHLEWQATGKDVFVINRSFEAPINLMFDFWTDPGKYSQWLAPTGFTMSFIKADIKVGATTFYSMSNSQGMTMYGRAHYLELKRPTGIVYTQQFCDENQNISRHPMAPTWPETLLTRVTLADEGDNRARVTVTFEVYGEASAQERETFNKAKGGMTMGWTGAFDKLEACLSA